MPNWTMTKKVYVWYNTQNTNSKQTPLGKHQSIISNDDCQIEAIKADEEKKVNKLIEAKKAEEQKTIDVKLVGINEFVNKYNTIK